MSMKRAIGREKVRFIMKQKGVTKINKRISEYYRKTREFILEKSRED